MLNPCKTNYFFPALICERDEHGSIVSVRQTATKFKTEEEARKRYGEKFLHLVTSGSQCTILFNTEIHPND